ncbi:hypothetical protein GE061_017235 [Apolygus lucorum]|uniref:Uncharacterized protein n=1 Tax=Apolygus lucorum TaxID=248454 RepID=A0A8S9XAA3_APOLU|nr:hypothetical protein GE061_017235 [Apolygus lucorum]
MSSSQSRLKRLLAAIQNMFGFQVCVKRKSTPVKGTDEKLLNIFNDLTVGISEVFEDDTRSFEEFLKCDRVSCKIRVLNEQIGQVRILYSLWKSGYDLNPEDLTAKCQSLNLLVDCIRDDVFCAYLRMSPEQKLKLLKKNKQVSSIFAVLGSLENEVTDMVKTMLPNGEILKLIRPLLRPEFNRSVFRRCARNVMNRNVPHCFQTIEFCYKGLPFDRPIKVDASTDPIDVQEWQNVQYTPTAFGDCFYTTSSYVEDFCKSNKGKDVKSQGNQMSQLTISSKQSYNKFDTSNLVRTGDDRDISQWNKSGAYCPGALDVRSKTFVTVDSCCKNGQFGSSRDRLSIVSDVEDVLGIPSDCWQNSYSAERLNGGRTWRNNSGVNLWKLAADMIVENPVLD